MHPLLKKFVIAYIVATVLFVFIVSALNAKNDSAIFDEVAHIPAGYSYLTEHDWRLNPEHPPLLKALAGMPLLLLNLNFDISEPYWTEDVNGQWDAGRAFLYNSGNNWDAILFWSRVPIIFVSIALGLFLLYWGYRWIGLTGGLVAFTLAMFDPNILGHNHYVTTDVGIAAFIAFSLYFFLKFVRKPTWTNVLLGGFFLGLAHLAKFSSVLLLPLYGVILVAYPLFRMSRDGGARSRAAQVGEYLGKGFAAFVVSMAVVWIGYALCFYATPADTVSRTVDFYFHPDDARSLAVNTNHVLHALTDPTWIRPIGEYATGVAMVFKRVAGGNGAYFMGQVSDNAFAWYFPAVFFLKETIPFLILLLFAFVFGLLRTENRAAKAIQEKTVLASLRGSLRSSLTLYAMLGFVFLYAYLSITGNLNIGFRHLFPILPFLYLAVSYAVARSAQLLPGLWKIAFSVSIAILLLWNIFATMFAYPYYMSYFNAMAGGPKNGYHFVTDSNADWGQDLERLKKWMNDYGKECNAACREVYDRTGKYVSLGTVHVDYFGGGDILKVLGSNNATLWWDSRRPIESGWYAISTNFIQGSIYDTRKPENESYRWLANYDPPVDQVGTSILIYYVP